jgi:EmrB/QacA subfamily drug resistance transporter
MKKNYQVLASVAVGTFMATLDSSIVNVALPTITQSFKTGIVTSRWVIISYLLSITTLLLLVGKLADLFNRKKIFAFGYLIFTLGSLLCGMSHTIEQLIFFRVIQGIGASMLMSNGPAIITACIPGNERGKILGILSMIVSAGLVLGPPIGGVLIQNYNWHSIFLINIPFGILGIIFVIKFISETNLNINNNQNKNFYNQLPWIMKIQAILDRFHEFDWLGAIFWMIIQVGYSLALDHENSLGLEPSLQKFIIFSSLGLFILFLLWENSILNPILDLNLFKNYVFLASNLSAVFNFIALSSITILLPFYFQNILNLEPQRVGFFLTAIPIAILIIAPIGGRLSDKFGSKYLTIFGMTIICFILLLLFFKKTGIGYVSTKALYVYLLFIGVGVGLFQPANNNAIMSVVDSDKLGIASALLATIRNFAMVTGTALSTSFLTLYYNNFIKKYPHTPIKDNFILSLRYTFLTIACICALGILSSSIKNRKNYDATQTTTSE